ncbi:MAG: alpha/beta fold hydrolase [Cyanobacteria bacterium P01_F01_bin.150]
MSPIFSIHRPTLAIAFSLAVSLIGSFVFPKGAAQAASEIRASFGPIQASIPFASLETYVNDGVIDDELEPYSRYFSDDQLMELRSVLATPIALEINNYTISTISHFLYSAPGEVLLSRIGNIVRTRKKNGLYALRAAVLLAATDDQDFTPLNMIRHFPTDSLVLDFETGLGIARDAQQAINQSTEAIAVVKQQFQDALAANPPEPPPSRLNQPPVVRYPWNLVNGSIITLENRAFPVDIYVPERDTPAPIVVISHGLGSNRDSYQYLATYLAASGFAVVVPEHAGSNATYIQALLEGKAEQVADPTEFLNRAKDISLILTTLTQQAETNPDLTGRLDFENIGVIGQSFGGYTALALAGATIDFNRLREICPTRDEIENGSDRSLNLSLILQCRAIDLATLESSEGLPPLEELSLRDDRIDAVIAINPIGSALFGPEGIPDIEIPVLMMTGSADVVAPMLWEQIYPFSWLQTPEKFLVTMHRGTHFSTIGTTEEDIPLPEAILGPVPQTARRYVQSISLPFFQTYLSAGPNTQTEALTPALIRRLSGDRMPLSLIRDFDLDDIN